jgi:hypothetical protein
MFDLTSRSFSKPTKNLVELAGVVNQGLSEEVFTFTSGYLEKWLDGCRFETYSFICIVKNSRVFEDGDKNVSIFRAVYQPLCETGYKPKDGFYWWSQAKWQNDPG